MRRRWIAIALLAAVSMAAARAPRVTRPAPPAVPQPTRIRPPSFVQCVTWLPDSTRLLAVGFDSTTFRIYSVRLDGSGYEPLTDGPDMWPTPGPDGTHILFQSNRGKRPRLFVMKPDGSQQEELHTQPRDPRTPAWSPRGDRVALSAKTDSLQRLCLMRPDGSELRAIPQGPGNDWNPAWSPDGSRLVFFTTYQTVDSVCVAQADGSGRRAVAAGFYPSWTPDGRRIVYTRNDTVYINIPEGGAEKPIIPGAFYSQADPRTGRIAVITGKWPNSTLWVRPAHGGAPRQLMP